MKVKYVMIVSAIILLMFGIAFLFVPVWTMGLFDIAIDTGGILMVQLLAAAFLGIAVLNWMGRNYVVADDVRSLISANFVMNVVGFGVALYHKINGVGNNWYWIPITLYLVFALAYGYCLAVKSAYEEPTISPRHT